jgi:hypothetical protein
MSFRDQQKYLDELRKYEKKFDRNELEEYKMYMKMHKDEEEFDSVSLNNCRNYMKNIMSLLINTNTMLISKGKIINNFIV